MKKLLVRHGLSTANDRNAVDTLAFARPDGTLMKEGRVAARKVGNRLRNEYGIDLALPVATSELRRTKETAAQAGFMRFTAHACLNEVRHGMELPNLKHMLREERRVPQAAIEQAHRILDAPPDESVWFTHGLVMLGLSHVLGYERSEHERFVPNFCEIIELPID